MLNMSEFKVIGVACLARDLELELDHLLRGWPTAAWTAPKSVGNSNEYSTSKTTRRRAVNIALR